MTRWRFPTLALVTLALAAPAVAQIDERLSLSGGYEFYSGHSLGAEAAFLAARNRADARLAFRYDRGTIVLHPRATFDALAEDLRLDLREAYAEVFFEQMDLKVGHQLIVWGRTDGAFVTDLLAPLDLSEFLAQPFDDLRLPVTAASGTLFLGDAELTGVIIPRRPTSRLPEPGSPWFPAPAAVLGVPVTTSEPAGESPPSVSDAEAAIRVNWRGLPRTDVTLVWMTGFNRIPAYRKGVQVRLQPQVGALIVLTPAYERRQVFGVSSETLALAPFVVRAEAAYHTAYLFDQPIEIPGTVEGLTDPAFADAASRGFLIRRPFFQAAVGAERTFGLQTLGLQALARVVVDHDERVAADPFEPAVSLLWLGRFRRETVTTRFFGLYNVGKDFWLNPEIGYAVQDGLNVSLGGQVFGGEGPDPADLAGILREPAFRFSTFRDNSFAYLRLRYQF
jgi:hypothetical protein